MSNEETSRRSTRSTAVPMALLLLMLLVMPIFAITHGEADGSDHPFVGSMVFKLPDGQGGYELYQMCSGTLIADDVFLTAAHCTYGNDALLADYPGSEIVVTFDPTISSSGTFYSGQAISHPDFAVKGGGSNPADVAVILLDQSPGITPASLPPAGMLDELERQHLLKETRFTTVGYGVIRDSNKRGFQGIRDNLDRNRVDQGFHALTKVWLKLPMTPSNGSGGTCYGDSGGPHFIHLNGEETTIVASLTVTGDAPCKASDVTYRVDTAYVRDFLSAFVDLS